MEALVSRLGAGMATKDEALAAPAIIADSMRKSRTRIEIRVRAPLQQGDVYTRERAKSG
jgi:hypothetical protein